ncbi:Putative lipoprotein [Alteromonadaceae bacterium Bs31]|nr:Putative lipoprotein [Alteromonadaceae bacterium Bs31]
MKTMKPFILMLVASLFLAACSSLVDKGDKLYEAGEFEEAAEFYQRALRKDPNNVDATIGLKRAQEKIIDRGLIDVRMLRLSRNMEGAAQRLEQILRNQKKWGLQAAGAVALTQNEETRFARGWLAEESNALAESRFPDKYRFFETQYAFLIAGSVSLKKRLAQHEAQVNSKGKRSCQALAGKVKGQRFFLKDFTRKYCAMWQAPVTLQVDAKDQTRYTNLSVNNAVRYSVSSGNNYYGTFNRDLESLAEVFRGSIWQAEEGRGELRVTAEGGVKYSRQSRQVMRYANYTVSKKIKTKNSAGEEVVKIHEEDKIHRYRARVYTEDFQINIGLQSTVDGKPLSRTANYQDSHQTESHSEDFSLAGLQPQSPAFMDLPYIFKAEINALQQTYLSALDQHWNNKYCEGSLGTVSGENVLRCAAINKEHSYVNSWFESKFGLNYEELASLVGI